MVATHSNAKWITLSRKRIAIARANNEPCGMCGRSIDYSLKGTHRYGPTSDHPNALAWGGDLIVPIEELRVVHRSCNSRQGARIRNAKARMQKQGRVALPDAPARSHSISLHSETIEAQPVEDAAHSMELNVKGVAVLSDGDDHPARYQAPAIPDIAPLDTDDTLMLQDCSGGMPRFFTPAHPRAVGTLFDQACEDFIVKTMGYEMRPWQRAVLRRAFEVDEDGRLVWRVIIVSVGRQSGKTYLIRMLTNLRQRLFARYEPQEILHIGRVRDAARAVIVNERFARWAKGRGVVVRSSNGQEQWRWPDDSTWDLSSLDGAYGRSAGLVLLDETWDITRQQYYEGIQPTMAAREQAQVWFFSAAHREATELTPLMIERARAGREGYALFDWGAQPDDDLTEPETWQRMGPHWDENRRAAVADAIEEESFSEQWANRWPDVLGRAKAQSAFPTWSDLPVAATKEPPFGAVVAIDEHFDASAAMVVAYHNGQLWAREVPDLRAAIDLALTWTDREVLVGFSLRHVVGSMGLRHATPYGMKETNFGLPLLLDAVKNRQLSHEHSELMYAQAAGARLKTTDSGTMSLSVKGSTGVITGLKLAAWCLWFEKSSTADAPTVW